MKNVKLAFSIKFIQGFLFLKEKLEISMVMNVYWFYYDFSVGLYVYMYMCAHTSVFTVEGREALK